MFAIILVFITLSTMSLCKIHLPLCCHVIINPPLTRSVSCQNSAMDSMHTGESYLLASSVWAAIMNEDMTMYETDEYGQPLLPAIDVDKYFA